MKTLIGRLVVLIAIFGSAIAQAQSLSFKFQLYQAPKTLNPLEVEDDTSMWPFYFLYDSLLWPDSSGSDRGLESRWKPQIAKEWKWISQKHLIEFEIHEEARFHDGTRITSQDVQFSVEVAQGWYRGSPNEHYLKGIQVLPLDTKKFRVRFPKDNFLQFDFFVRLPIFSRKDPELNGSGPFQAPPGKVDLKRKGLALKSVRSWIGQKGFGTRATPEFDEIKFVIEPDYKKSLELLERAELDFQLVSQDMQNQKKLPKGVKSWSWRTPLAWSVTTIQINLTSEKLKDKTIRQKIFQNLPNSFCALGETTYSGPLMNPTFEKLPDLNLKEPLIVQLIKTSNDWDSGLNEWTKKLKKEKVELKSTLVDSNQLVRHLRTGEFDVVVSSHLTYDLFNPREWLGAEQKPPLGFNFSGVQGKSWEALLSDFESAYEESNRDSALKKIDSEVAQNAFFAIVCERKDRPAWVSKNWNPHGFESQWMIDFENWTYGPSGSSK